MPDRYDLVRKAEHATLGDSYERLQRDPDAFTAGAQYALDHMLSRTVETINLFGESAGSLLVSQAADILAHVHDGTL
jgi:hypothetical protein